MECRSRDAKIQERNGKEHREGQGRSEMKSSKTGSEKNKGKKRDRKHRCNDKRNTGGEKHPIMVNER